MSLSLSEYLAAATRRVRIRWHSAAPVPANLEHIVGEAPWLTVERVPPLEQAPTVSLHADEPHGGLEWYGAIEGKLLAPFVEALRALGTGVPELDTPATVTAIRQLNTRCCIEVFVAKACPYCPATSAAALRLAVLSSHVAVRVRRADLERAPVLVRGVPAVLSDGRLLSEGPIGEYDLADRLVSYARGK